MTQQPPDWMDFDRLANEMRQAITTVILNHGGPSMLTRWVVIAESAELGGAEPLWCLADPDSKSWHVKGLLTHALDIERAHTLIQVLSQQDEDN